ncbi:MAG: hypothetical protein AB1705_12430 [Verrucomicrobiota bacterium]
MPLAAQETKSVEQLSRELKQLQESFQKQQQLYQQQIDALQKQLESLKQTQTTVAAEQDKLKEAMKTGMAEQPRPESVEPKPWRPTDPIQLRKGAAYLDLGLVGTFAAGGSTANDIGNLQPGGHDPNQRGFSLQGLEATFSGAVDPYFRALSTIVFGIDNGGETFVEVEEGWLETTSLPANLQLRAGQMLSEFGRLNAQHVHSWAFADTSLVNARFLGADGLRNLGARVSWLAPTPFYSELFLGVQNSQGETAASFRSDAADGAFPLAFRSANNDRGVSAISDLLFTPRYAVSFDLSDSHTLLLGASAALGPNSRGDAGTGNSDTQIYGVDLTWKWKPTNHQGGFPFVQWQTEAMLRKYGANAFDWDQNADGGDGDGNGFVDGGILVDPLTGLPAVLPRETLTDYGFYTQLLYGFKKGWVAGLRFDYVSGDRGAYEQRGLEVGDNAGVGGTATLALAGNDLQRQTRYRISPNLTWYPTEFSKIRLQYNYDDRTDVGIDHSVWLQFEFVLGAHAAHKF